MSKRGFYGPNKHGSGYLYLERACFDKENNKDFVILLGSPNFYPFEHKKSGESNKVVLCSGFNKVKHTHIGHKNGYILYGSEFERDERLNLAKEELESYGFEIEVL